MYHNVDLDAPASSALGQSCETEVPNRFLHLDPTKLRGGYYTPTELADWIVAWCVRSSTDEVLEPSSGDGRFLEAVGRRLSLLGAPTISIAKQITGVEVAEVEAEKAVAALRTVIGLDANEAVIVSDFFEWWHRSGRGLFDAVVGNPPFIRYQSFPEPHRGHAMKVLRDLGLHPNKLTNSWVPFVAASVRALRPGGRIGFVLPAELLQVTYAAQLRTFLVENFREIHILTCNELFFDKAEQEVVVLLADGALTKSDPKNDCAVAVSVTDTAKSLLSTPAATYIQMTPKKHVRHNDEKWLKYFLSQKQIDLLRDLRELGTVQTLGSYGSVDVGIVTGRNEFFVVSGSQAKRWNLEQFLVPLAARAAHLKGAAFTKADWTSLATDDERVYLLQLGRTEAGSLPQEALAYVKQGEEASYHLGYKCSIRAPWYDVPAVWAPDAFLFRQIHEFPRLVLNEAQAVCTDTIHRFRLHRSTAEKVLTNSYTSLTGASAEIEGRSYGGGVLELEPTEAERVLVPSVGCGGLSLIEIDRMVRAGRLHDVIDLNDREILGQQLGLSAGDRQLLRDAWDTMRQRRTSRSRRALSKKHMTRD